MYIVATNENEDGKRITDIYKVGVALDENVPLISTKDPSFVAYITEQELSEYELFHTYQEADNSIVKM